MGRFGFSAKPCRKLTPNIHSSHDLSRPEAKRFRVKLTNLNIPKIDLVEVFIDLLEAENLKSNNLADEYPAFVPADVAAVVHSAKHKPLRMSELDRTSREQHRASILSHRHFAIGSNSGDRRRECWNCGLDGPGLGGGMAADLEDGDVVLLAEGLGGGGDVLGGEDGD